MSFECAGLPALLLAWFGCFVQRGTQLFGCLLRDHLQRVRFAPLVGTRLPWPPPKKKGLHPPQLPELIRARSCTSSNLGLTGVSAALSAVGVPAPYAWA